MSAMSALATTPATTAVTGLVGDAMRRQLALFDDAQARALGALAEQAQALRRHGDDLDEVQQRISSAETRLSSPMADAADLTRSTIESVEQVAVSALPLCRRTIGAALDAGGQAMPGVVLAVVCRVRGRQVAAAAVDRATLIMAATGGSPAHGDQGWLAVDRLFTRHGW